MANPFLRRATEYIRDASAFLSIVSPEPLITFVGNNPDKARLFEMPVRVVGSPGSGKTMMASLVEFRMIEAIVRDQSSENSRTLAAALSKSGFIDKLIPQVAAVRLPMESEYRDFWELPYDETVKNKLLLSLIQARAVLALFRNLTANGRRELSGVRLIARDDATSQLEQIGGSDAMAMLDRARAVERAIYDIGARLVPPRIEDLSVDASSPYQPFEVLREIEIDWNGKAVRLRPLVILDDVHSLHPDQLDGLFRALTRREIRIGRWMMMRMDALSPGAVFQSKLVDEHPGVKPDRDFIAIAMQSPTQRRTERNQFRKMAAGMADRYLRHVETLEARNFSRFSDLLSSAPPSLPAGKFEELKRKVSREQNSLDIPQGRRSKIDDIVLRYSKGAQSSDVGEDVQLGMSRVLLNRYAVRLRSITPSLFGDDGPETKKPLKAEADIAGAARLYLHAEFQRPFHYGLDALCDASNENAELFLQLAGALVDRMETKAIRNQDPALTPAQQQAALKEKADAIIGGWNFPFIKKTRGLIANIASACLEKSLQPNAPLGYGANAIGIPDEEVERLLNDGEASLVLKFAVAYGALVAVRDYGQGGKSWCLLELAGPVCLSYGLTLNRGGFLEWDAETLSRVIDEV